MESEHCFLKFENNSDSNFLRIYSLQSSSKRKLFFDEAFFQKIYGTELVRFYSRPAVFLTHLMELSGFRNWVDLNQKMSIYGAIPEGSFDFEFQPQSTASEIHRQYGPRQYLKSFAAFSVYGPVNHFQLSAPVNTFSCSRHRLLQAFEEASLDLRSGEAEQVLILGSNLNDCSESEPESVFCLATDNLKALQKAHSLLKDLPDENSFYWNLEECFRRML